MKINENKLLFDMWNAYTELHQEFVKLSEKNAKLSYQAGVADGRNEIFEHYLLTSNTMVKVDNMFSEEEINISDLVEDEGKGKKK